MAIQSTTVSQINDGETAISKSNKNNISKEEISFTLYKVMKMKAKFYYISFGIE